VGRFCDTPAAASARGYNSAMAAFALRHLKSRTLLRRVILRFSVMSSEVETSLNSK